MWRSKKPDERQTAKLEPKNLQGNQLSGPPAASLQGTTQVNKEALGPTGVMMGRPARATRRKLAFEGLVQLDEGKLTIGTTAKVTADVTARVVVVQCEGQCTANDRIEIKKDGSVNGDLTTAQIIIEDGAYFKGSIEIADGMCTDSPGGGRGAEEYLITKECLRSYAQDRDNKWFAEFGCSHLKSGDAGYMFPFVLRCAIILPMHRAKGVRP